MKSQIEIQELYSDVLKAIKDVDKMPKEFRNTPLIMLEAKKHILEIILGQEQTYLEIDDHIMPETIIAEGFAEDGNGNVRDVKIQDIDEPYRAILLTIKDHPVKIPFPYPEQVCVVSFTIFPNGSVYRNTSMLEEDFLRQIDLEELRGFLNRELIKELTARYIG